MVKPSFQKRPGTRGGLRVVKRVTIPWQQVRFSKGAYAILKIVTLAIAEINSLTRGHTMKALDAASYLIELANKTPENDLTNLKLQKLLYYVQGKYIAQNGTPLFEDKIEAWKYGPVVADVYHTFKECGQFPVTTFDINYDSTELDADSKSFIEKIWEDIGEKYSGFFLVQTTHKDGTPWAKYFDEDGRNIEIPQSDLKEYFTSNEL